MSITNFNGCRCSFCSLIFRHGIYPITEIFIPASRSFCLLLTESMTVWMNRLFLHLPIPLHFGCVRPFCFADAVSICSCLLLALLAARGRRVLENRSNADDEKIEQLEAMLKLATDHTNEAESKYDEVRLPPTRVLTPTSPSLCRRCVASTRNKVNFVTCSSM